MPDILSPGSPGAAARERRTSWMDSLAAVLSTEAGAEVLEGILESLGVADAVDEGAPMHLHNFGRLLLRDMAEANPDATLRIIAALHDIGR